MTEIIQSLHAILPDHWEVCISITPKLIMVYLLDEDSRILFSGGPDSDRTLLDVLQSCIAYVEDARP